MLGSIAASANFCRNSVLLLACLLTLFCLALQSAEARVESGYGQAARLARAQPRSQKQEKPKKPKPGAVLVLVSLPKQRIAVYGKDGLIAHSAVSSGQPGHPTPTGIFTVVQKSRYHRSNIYSGAPMPFMQRITWSGIALHAGVLPGYPASHGCIRLNHSFAVELWGMTKMNARVVVTNEDVGVNELVHSQLPVPVMTPAPEASTDPMLTVALNEKESELARNPALLSPLERATAAKLTATADAAAKARRAKEAVAQSAARAAEANRVIIALRNAEARLVTARTKVQAAMKAAQAVRTTGDMQRAEAAHVAAERELDEASKAHQDAMALEATKTAEAFAAARDAWQAESASKAAGDAMQAAVRGIEPISIFISKKTGRVQIRQAWASVYEAPVTIKDPDTPLGTHLYVAMELLENGTGMRWQTVSLSPPPPPGASRRHARGGEEHASAVFPPATRETATTVLDRLQMSEETRQFIADRLWTGVSMIISDQGFSDETGEYTDFIVKTR